MKNYKSSDYAANKYSPNIVYRFGNETVEITLEKFLVENPDMTEDDFLRFKALSDAIYLEQVKAENAQTKKNIPIHLLEETEVCAVEPIEKYIEEQEEKAVLQAVQRFLDSDILTETQKRRFVLYFITGLTVRQIAEIEHVYINAIEECLTAAIKKLKKFL